MKKKTRDSNIELLRIFSMIIIVLHHAIYHGVFKNLNDLNYTFLRQNFANFTISNILISGGKVSVIIFIIITGYFSSSKNFKINKIFPLLLQTSFYSMCGLTLGIFTGQYISFFTIFKQFFPIIYSQYWFITVYIVIYLVSPLITEALDRFSNQKNFFLMIFLVLINLLFPTFFPGSLSEVSNYFLKFVLFFITGYMLKKYSKKWSFSKKHGLILLGLCFFIYITSIFAIEIGSILLHINVFKKSLFFSNLQSPLVYLAAIGLFIVFKEMKIKNNNFINHISKFMFGVYLIHDNKFVRPIIWTKLFKLDTVLNADPLVLLSLVLLSVIIVFVSSILIEAIRSYIFQGIEMKLLDINTKIPKRLEKFFQEIKQ